MKANVPLAARLLVLSTVIASLMSCGGGGGGGGSGGSSTPPPPPSTPAALTAANMKTVTEDVLNFPLSFLSVGASSSSNVGEVPLSAQPKAQPRPRLLFGILRGQLGSPAASTRVPLAVSDCDNVGQGTITTNPQPTSNTVTFSNCLSGGETINGTLTLTNITSPTTGETTGHVSHNLSFAQTNLPTLSSSGEFDIDHTVAGTVITDKLTGGPINLLLGGDAVIISAFTITSVVDTSVGGGETDNIVATVATTAIGGSVSVTNPTAFQTVAGSIFPNTGQLLIKGASNSTVRVTVLGDEKHPGDQVTLEVDPEGDGTFQPAMGFSWATL